MLSSLHFNHGILWRGMLCSTGSTKVLNEGIRLIHRGQASWGCLINDVCNPYLKKTLNWLLGTGRTLVEVI